jgi:hypothetical protein
VRLAVAWPLAWLRHERAPSILRRSYYLEQDGDVKAQMVRVATSLMTDDTGSTSARIADEILQDALQNRDERIRKVGQEIAANRSRAGMLVPQQA